MRTGPLFDADQVQALLDVERQRSLGFANELTSAKQTNQQLRSALRDAMSFVDRESAGDYERWERLLRWPI